MKVLVLTHYYAQGPSQELVKFLRRRKISVDFISHPFSYCKDTRSWIESLDHEDVIKSTYFCPWKGPAIGFFAKDFALNLIWSERSDAVYDVAIAYDCLNATSALLLRRLGKVKKVIYGCIDYTLRRFESSLLDRLYFKVDEFAASQSDLVWNLSNKMHERRQQIFNQTSLAPALVVPTGGDFEHIERVAESEVNRFRLVYMGHLRPFQGVELAIDSVAALAKTYPKVSLDIFGGGPLMESLQQRASKLGVTDRVVFHGFIEKHEDLEKALSHRGIGLGLYEPDPKSFTPFTDTNKPQVYMACGLPVLLTSVTNSCKEVTAFGAAQTVEYTLESVTQALEKWLDSPSLHLAARRKAIEFAESRSWTRIFDQALAQSTSLLELPISASETYAPAEAV